MNIEDVAKSLLEALKANPCETNIQGTVTVLNALVGSINADWEEYITQDTNDILAEDNICCECCRSPIKIIRERKVVYVYNS